MPFPCAVHYNDLDQVIAYARAMVQPYPSRGGTPEGSALVVTKDPARDHYPIDHVARKDLYRPDKVVWPAQ